MVSVLFFWLLSLIMPMVPTLCATAHWNHSELRTVKLSPQESLNFKGKHSDKCDVNKKSFGNSGLYCFILLLNIFFAWKQNWNYFVSVGERQIINFRNKYTHCQEHKIILVTCCHSFASGIHRKASFKPGCCTQSSWLATYDGHSSINLINALLKASRPGTIRTSCNKEFHILLLNILRA